MPVRAFGASTFGLRGGIPMEAAQANIYHAPESRVGTTRPTRISMNHQLSKKRGAPMPPSEVRECTRRIKARGQGASREETTPLPIRAPYLRPLLALSQRPRSCTGTSGLLKIPGAYTQVAGLLQGQRARQLYSVSSGAYATIKMHF